jgi:hypothetical protein
MQPVMVRSAASWSSAVSRTQGAGNGSRLPSARISISTGRWQRTGRPGSSRQLGHRPEKGEHGDRDGEQLAPEDFDR